jgi:hypothetical protein
MSRTSVQIKRPRLLGGLTAAVIGATAMAFVSLLGAAARLGADPIEIQAGTERLEAALADRAAVSPEAAVVWAVTTAECGDCLSRAGADLAGLRADGFEVRVVRLAPSARLALDAVLRENGGRLALPAVFWRRGQEWRAMPRLDPRTRALLRAEFNPEA